MAAPPAPLHGLNLDPDTATDLVRRGSTLLLLDVPPYTVLGLDTQMYTVGPSFKGIKMIPPGVHFVYYSSSTRDGKECSPMIGFFIVTSPAEVIVRQWNQQDERLVNVAEDEETRYSEAVRNMQFDHQLGPYALNCYGDWKQLSNYITRDIVDKIAPIGGDISVECEGQLFDELPKTLGEKRLVEQLNAKKVPVKPESNGELMRRRGCYYTTILRNVKYKGVYGEALTSLNLDKTELLESILINSYGGDENQLLGELQYSFVAFLMGQSLEAFLQWKALVSLLLGCTAAPLCTRSCLFAKFLKVLFYQIKHGFGKSFGNASVSEEGASILLDDSWLSNDIFLRHLCKDFFQLVLEETVVDGDLLAWTRKLKELLETCLGWDFSIGSIDDVFEEDEFAPVVEMVKSESEELN